MWLLLLNLGGTHPTQAGGGTTCVGDFRQEQLSGCVTELELYEQAENSEEMEGNYEIANELGTTSAKKHQMQKKRLSELGITDADENLMSQEVFVSVVGNQFKWNGKGSFGTFLFWLTWLLVALRLKYLHKLFSLLLSKQLICSISLA